MKKAKILVVIRWSKRKHIKKELAKITYIVFA